MKKARITLRTISFVLIAVLILIFLLGCSDYGFIDKESIVRGENLAKKSTVSTENGQKSAFSLVDGDAKSLWRPGERVSSVILDFGEEVTFNTIILREKGWNIKDFSLYIEDGVNEKGDIKWNRFYRQDKIEDYRLCTFEKVTAKKLKLTIDKSNAYPKLAELEIYDSQPVTNTSFVPSAYLRNKSCAEAVNAKPGDNNYLDPAYFDVIKRVTMIGTGSLNDESGEMNMINMPGTNVTYAKVALEHLRNTVGNRDIEIFYSGFYGGKNVFEEPMRTKAIQNVLNFLIENNLDGFDFDWEFPKSHEEFDKLSTFIVEMKKAFAPHGKKISTAWYAWDNSLSKEAIEAIDHVNVMGYDEYDQDGNICSFMSGALQPVQYFLDLGFRPEQIVLGLPYYTRAYVNGELLERMVDHPDAALSQFVGESDGFVFNSPQLISDKTAYAIYENLGGVFAWSLMIDKEMSDPFSMTRAIQKTVNQRLSSTGEVAQ